MVATLAARGGPPGRLMIDGVHLEARRTPASLVQKGSFPPFSAAVSGRALGIVVPGSDTIYVAFPAARLVNLDPAAC